MSMNVAELLIDQMRSLDLSGIPYTSMTNIEELRDYCGGGALLDGFDKKKDSLITVVMRQNLKLSREEANGKIDSLFLKSLKVAHLMGKNEVEDSSLSPKEKQANRMRIVEIKKIMDFSFSDIFKSERSKKIDDSSANELQKKLIEEIEEEEVSKEAKAESKSNKKQRRKEREKDKKLICKEKKDAKIEADKIAKEEERFLRLERRRLLREEKAEKLTVNTSGLTSKESSFGDLNYLSADSQSSTPSVEKQKTTDYFKGKIKLTIDALKLISSEESSSSLKSDSQTSLDSLPSSKSESNSLEESFVKEYSLFEKSPLDRVIHDIAMREFNASGDLTLEEYELSKSKRYSLFGESPLDRVIHDSVMLEFNASGDLTLEEYERRGKEG
jgi:hypothetical protein